MLLCAEDLYPDPKTYLGFSMCLIKDYQHIPQRSLIEDCALEHAIDFGKLDECASKDDGAWGVEMLRNSVRRSSDVGCRCVCGHMPGELFLTNSTGLGRDHQELYSTPGRGGLLHPRRWRMG